MAPTKVPQFEGSLGWPLHGATFRKAAATGPHALFSPNDRIVCRTEGVWIVSYPVRRPNVRIRHYTSDGRLLRFVDTTLPVLPRAQMEFDEIDPASVREEAGRIRFDRVVSSLKDGTQRERKRESFELAP